MKLVKFCIEDFYCDYDEFCIVDNPDLFNNDIKLIDFVFKKSVYHDMLDRISVTAKFDISEDEVLLLKKFGVVDFKLSSTPIKIKIAWGSDQYEDDIKDYSFDTLDKYHSFMEGVDESNGWMEYTTIGEGDYGAYETIEDWRKRNDWTDNCFRRG